MTPSTIALAYLDDAVRAAGRLRHKADRDALHDFRVAIRRLRVTIRSYRELHERVSKKQWRRLRKLARATNPARDAEVQIAWFNDHASRFTTTQRAAVSQMRARLRARRRSELRRIRERLDDSFAQVEHKLRRRLVALSDEPDRDRRTAFPRLAAVTLIRLAGELDARLKTIARGVPAAPRAMHGARIAAKRLRYTLEPVVDQVPGSAVLVTRLKQLQDRFGVLTDAHEMDQILRADRVAAAAVREMLEAETAESTAALQAHLRENADFHTAVVTAVRPLRPPRSGGPLFRHLPARRPLPAPARP